MSSKEILHRYLEDKKAEGTQGELGLEDDYIEKLPTLEVEGEVRVWDVADNDLREKLGAAGLTKMQKAAVIRLLGMVGSVHNEDYEFYNVIVGDIRRLSDEEIMLLGSDVSRFHPGPRSVEILRRLFGREEVEEKG